MMTVDVNKRPLIVYLDTLVKLLSIIDADANE